MDRGFNTSFGLISNVHYGRDPVFGIKTIPYKGGDDPAIGSEFDDDIEKIAFTLQDYAQNGVSYDQVFRVIAGMHQRAVSELRSSDSRKGLNINHTAASKEFDDFIKKIDPEQRLGEYISLSMISTPARIKALTAVVNGNAISRASFCRNYVINSITEYRQQIHSISTDVPDMVHNFGGFSGTPYNLHTYHDKIQAEKNPGVDGRTWALLLQDDNVRTTPIISFDFDPKRPVQSLNQGTGFTANFQAMIDTGAYLRGVSSKEYIDACLEEAQNNGLDVEAGIYFNDAGLLVKQMEKGGKAFAIETAPSTNLMNTRTLYPQKFTVGADVLQARKARAVVTIGEKTYLRDLFQAVWRLRQLHEDQRVVFAVSAEIRKLILNGEDRPLQMIDILKFCLKNEVMKEAEDNFRSEKGKLHGIIKRELMAGLIRLIDQDCSLEVIADIAYSQKELFTKIKKTEEAFDRDIKIRTHKDPGDMIKRIRELEIENCKVITQYFREKGIVSAVERFEALLVKLENRKNPPADWMPNLVEEGAVDAGEVEVEAHTELTLELDLKIESLEETETEEVVEQQIPMVRTGHGATGNVVGVISEQISDLVTGRHFDTNSLRQLSRSIDLFSPQFFCTSIFERNLAIDGTGSSITPSAVFYSTRKPVTQVLIVKNNMGRMSMIVPTIHEAHGGCRQYINKNATKDDIIAVQVAITDGSPNIIYKNGRNRDDSIPFVGKDLDEFYQLYVQAKFFNGELNYNTEEERDALRAWIAKNGGPARFRNYFERNILAAKSKRVADAYPGSTLYKILNGNEKGSPASSSSSHG
jgi:hypothetical protein